MDAALTRPVKPFPFILHWYIWQVKYRDELSKQQNKGFGYRAGVFHPNGSKYGQHHDDWPAFFDRMAAQGWSYLLDIEAQFCYENYSSCTVFIDTSGTEFPFP